MDADRPHRVTQILEAIGAGDESAAEELVPLVYEELRGLAHALMARERPGQTLQPTALVHEAYLRLLGGQDPRFNDRKHFFNAAARAMRQVLVDRARAKARYKRGGDQERVTLDDAASIWEPTPEELLDLDTALTRLEELDVQMARVVQLRYFAGLTVDEAASAMGTAPRTTNRLWTAARAWLHNEIASA